MDRLPVNYQLPDYISAVVRGKKATGLYLPDSPFFRNLLETINTTVISEEIYKPIVPSANLYDCQNKALGKMLKYDNLLVNLSPGLGKTYVSSHFLAYTQNANVLIIAPKALHYVWSNHLDSIVGCEHVIRPKVHKPGLITVTNVQQLKNLRFAGTPDIVIFDESILIKNRNSLNFKLAKDKLSPIPFKYLLSGSPYSRSISDLWAQLNLLYPSVFTSFWDFAKIFCRVVVDQYGWKIVENRDNIESVLRYALKDFMYSAHIDDSADIPEITEIVVQIDPTKQQLAIEKEFRKKGIYKHITIDGPLSLLTRIKQLSLDFNILGLDDNTAKFDALSEMLGFIEYPAIVVSSSNVFLERLHRLHSNSTLFNADNPNGYQSYLSGEKELMFMQLASGKFGHSFTNTKTMIITDYTFNSDDLYQVLARVKRLTTRNPVTIYHLHSLLIDKVMYQLAKERNLSVDTVMKGLYENN